MARPKTTQTSENEGGVSPSRKRPGEDRRCLVTGETLSPDRRVRFACAPDGEVVPDVGGKLPGRGVWVTADRAIVESAKGRFAKGFRRSVTAPENLADLVEQRLLAKCQGVLAFARKSGEVVLGADQVKAEARKYKPGRLLEATDGADDGRRQIWNLVNGTYGPVVVCGALTSEELGMAFGRDHVVHGLLKIGRFAHVWDVEYGRLCGFRADPADEWFSRTGDNRKTQG